MWTWSYIHSILWYKNYDYQTWDYTTKIILTTHQYKKFKGSTSLDLKNFYNYIKMCLNMLNIPQEDLFTAYHFIKIHSEFEEYFILDCDHPYYSCNVQIYASLGHSLLLEITNNTCVKYSMAPQTCRVLRKMWQKRIFIEVCTTYIFSFWPFYEYLYLV